MFYTIAAILLVVIIFGPQLWVGRILKKHSQHRDEIPGTGGELARHLLDRFSLQEVGLEETDSGDHYDPTERVVRLSPEIMQGKSLTAITVAAHEVGHALQHQDRYAPLLLRNRMARIAAISEKCGAMLLVALPFITALSRLPAAGILMLIGGFAVLGVPILLHLLTLPVEIDASFKRALPLLQSGYIPETEMPAARRILTACALTYVAASLATLLNFWRWIAILRR